MIQKYRCERCGTEFEAEDWRNRRFCSRKCSAQRPNKGQYKKGHKHDETTEQKRIAAIKRNHKGMLGKKHNEETKKQMSESSKYPYNYVDGGYRGKIETAQCEICGVEQTVNNNKTNIDIHHIDGDRTNNVIKNLIALCHRCHMSVHHKNINLESE